MGNYFAALPVRLEDTAFDAIRKDAPSALRWFHPEDLHLTLAFLGPEVPERIPALLHILAEIPTGPEQITLGPLLQLPNPKRCSALAFSVTQGKEQVSGLISDWRAPLLAAASRPPDLRPPLPHLTIARPARQHPGCAPELLSRWAQNLEPPPGPVTVLPPVLFGWSTERPRRQFQPIG